MEALHVPGLPRPTTQEVRTYLEEKGLLRDGKPTPEAIQLGYARKPQGRDEAVWHLEQYIYMRRSENYVRYLRQTQQPVPLGVLDNALYPKR